MRILRWLKIFTLALCAFPLSTSSGRSQNSEDYLRRIIADWHKRQHTVRTVRYVLAGEGIIPKENLILSDPASRETQDMHPERDLVTTKSRRIMLDLVNNRMCKEMTDHLLNRNTGGLISFGRVQTFDGSLSKVLYPRDTNPPNTLDRGRYDADVWMVAKTQPGGVHFDLYELPVFLAHGIVATRRTDMIVGAMSTPKQLRPKLNADAFHVHGWGQFQNRDCLVLRTILPKGDPIRNCEEYWVDLARESAISRVRMYIRGRLWVDMQLHNTATRHGWLPDSWSCVFNTDKNTKPGSAPASMDQSANFRVSEREVNVHLDPGAFDIAWKPGMVFINPDQRPYRVSQDGHSLIDIVSERQISGRARLLFWVTGLVFIGGFAWLVRFLKQRS